MDNSSNSKQTPADQSLETPSTVDATQPSGDTGGESLESPSGVVPAPDSEPSSKKSGGGKRDLSVRGLLTHVNIYLICFIILILAGIIIAYVAYEKSNKQAPNNSNNAPTQNLSAQALQQLANNGTTIGDAEHTLNIQSNSVFAGTVLIRGNLEVAGTVKMGGSLALSGLSVSGSSSFGQLQAKGISVAGNEGVQGQLSAASLSIAGGGSFGSAVTAPAVTTNSLQLNGNLQLTHHINTGGAVPGRTNGSALGSGGTSSVGGSDTAGSINIHTGSNTAGGCFITVDFASAFGNTPHVIITPIGSAAAAVQYYVNRSSGGFSVCTLNAAPAGTSFGFDYIVIG